MDGIERRTNRSAGAGRVSTLIWAAGNVLRQP